MRKGSTNENALVNYSTHRIVVFWVFHSNTNGIHFFLCASKFCYLLDWNSGEYILWNGSGHKCIQCQSELLLYIWCNKSGEFFKFAQQCCGILVGISRPKTNSRILIAVNYTANVWWGCRKSCNTNAMPQLLLVVVLFVLIFPASGSVLSRIHNK